MPHNSAHRQFEEALLGMYEAFGHHRRLLMGDTPLTRDDRDRLVDCMNIMEEYMGQVWALARMRG